MNIEKLSKSACDMSLDNQSKVLNIIFKYFLVPEKVQIVKKEKFTSFD